jgi:hypothetical protein
MRTLELRVISLTHYPEPKPEKYPALITAHVYDFAEFLTGGNHSVVLSSRIQMLR